jgi:8-oxo-dGTP pyrophosphatase MutT (NUDIX family)
MRFLGGFYVFPGGAVHQGDYSPEMLRRCINLTGAEAQRMLGGNHDPGTALGHWVAVFRELFEEVGILLCVDGSGATVSLSDKATQKKFEAQRRVIVSKENDFGAFLTAENLVCDLSRAVYFDHWVTPDIYSMRFDTRFYIAVSPPAQTPLSHSEEVTHSLWIRPDEAMARLHRRDFPILPPTTTVLQNLARLATWERLCDEFKLC